MTSETRTCAEAVGGVRRLRALARTVGMSPSADAELARLEAAVEAAADVVRDQALEAHRAEVERAQPRLL